MKTRIRPHERLRGKWVAVGVFKWKGVRHPCRGMGDTPEAAYNAMLDNKAAKLRRMDKA